jgi:hypothetical protein
MRARALLVAFAAAVAFSTFATAAVADETSSGNDDLDPLRERFRAGLEKYRAGAFAEAILIWENIYRELGPEKGYRLAFNLARAYEQFGDPTRAAESYDAYVASTTRRREAGESLEPIVEKQEAEAIARLAELAATQGRIRIAGDRSVLVKIDAGPERLVPPSGWTAYVTPGKPHVVTFDPGTPESKQVDANVAVGELVELSPPPLHASAPTATTAQPRVERSPPPPERPYGPAVVYLAASVTVVSAALPIFFYARAGNIRSDYDAAVSQADASRRAGDRAAYDTALGSGKSLRDDYASTRSAAAISVAVPIVLGVATAGLAAYWLLGGGARARGSVAFPRPGGAAFGGALTF